MNGPAPTGEILLGKYRIDSVLGAHPAGDLRSGFDLRFERPVHLLVVRRPLERRQRQRLAQGLMRLRHPRLGVLLDHGELPDGQATLVFPPPQGRPLARWLPSAEPAQVVELLDQLLRALARLHASGLTHGALRPEVIHVQATPQGPIGWIGEVGAASLMADPADLAGPYAPPEGGPPAPSHDVYALASCVRRLAPELPAPLGPTLARAAAADPTRRMGDIGRILGALGRPLAKDRPLTPAPLAIPADPVATALTGMPSQPPRPAGEAAPTLQDQDPEATTRAAPPEPTAPPLPTAEAGPTAADGPVSKRDPRVRLSAEEVVAALGPRLDPTPPTADRTPRRMTRVDDSTTAPTPAMPPELEGTLELATWRPAAPRYTLLAVVVGALLGLAWAVLR
ncbi:MAG: hypothetical protein H6702_20555 [Myxococcales bacterium]|nr:hypothetical protein [Myxococcales bacterium]